MEEVIKVEGMKEYEDWKIDEEGGNRVKEYGERNIYIVEVIKQNIDLYLNPIRKICVMTKRNA